MAERATFPGAGPPVGHSGGSVTLIEGASFCVSNSSGDVCPGAAQGLFFRDTRFVSRLELLVNGQRPEPLSANPTSPFSATFVLRPPPRPGQAESGLVVFRRRHVGRGMREDLTVHNFGDEAAYCALDLLVDADFAQPMDVRDGSVEPAGGLAVEVSAAALQLGARRSGQRRGVRVTSDPPARVSEEGLRFEFIVAAGGRWSACVQLTPVLDGERVRPRHPCGTEVEETTPHARLEQWRRGMPGVKTDNEALRAAVARSAEDLGSLRIFDPDVPERTVLAAGAPWHMALFGRDSLLTAYMALVADPDLALGVLQTLARFQGEAEDPLTDEEPGRILHEMRFAEAASLSLGGRVSYGSADATPLFVMLLGELRRWGLVPELVDDLMPHADRALDWIETYGDRDGDGYVEYRRASDRGMRHQGWKDSASAVRFADGRPARPPIALCEIQGYTYGAYLARAHFADERGEAEVAARFRSKARQLKEAFNRDYWLEERGWFAMGLDADKRPIDALASNMGHCLWTGIVDEDKAGPVARHLVSPDLFSGWGVRTLARSMVGYNPVSHHSGSVWPHDNALCAAGLMRYGFVEEAHRVIGGMLDAAAALDHRLPELFCGLGRDEVPFPVRYPSACEPQAWAAATPLMFLRTLLRLDPWMPHGKVWLSPALPPGTTYLCVERIPLGGRVTVEVVDNKVSIDGLADDVTVVERARDPLTA